MAEDYLSDSDLQVVKMFLTEELRSTARRGVPMANIFDNVKDLLNLDLEDKVEFCKALSVAVNGDKMPELEVKKGPGGGVGFKGSNPTTTKLVSPLPVKKAPPPLKEVTPPVPVPEKSYTGVVVELPKPIVNKYIPKDKHDLWIGEAVYEVPYSKAHIRTLLKNVFGAKENDGGAISFEGVKYELSAEAQTYLDKFMFYFYGAAIVLKSTEVKRAL